METTHWNASSNKEKKDNLHSNIKLACDDSIFTFTPARGVNREIIVNIMHDINVSCPLRSPGWKGKQREIYSQYTLRLGSSNMA